MDVATPSTQQTAAEMSSEINSLVEQIETMHKRVAELRKSLPPKAVEDYEFSSSLGQTTRLSELFGDKSELLVIHNMGRKCVYCTLWADSLIGITKHLEDRAALVLSSPDDPPTQQQFATDRGWNFQMISTKGTTFKHDLGFEPKPGEYWPGVTTFRKNEDGSIEAIASAHFGPGDPYCGLWHFLDLLPTATDWEPKFHYA
jgi:predicted dithiol-disulfide oxidoreductase (DUF899 family)